jgi:hypothetical protein
MPTGPKGEKRPAAVNARAVMIARRRRPRGRSSAGRKGRATRPGLFLIVHDSFWRTRRPAAGRPPRPSWTLPAILTGNSFSAFRR